MKKTLAVFFIGIMMLFTLSACGNKGENTGTSNDAGSGETISVTLSIDYTDESGIADIDDQIIQVPVDSTVLDATMSAVDVVAEDSDGGTKYITSIGGLAGSGSSGWIFEVNDKTIMKTADKYVLSDGDELSWEYGSWEDMGD